MANANIVNDYVKGQVDVAPTHTEQNQQRERINKDELDRRLAEALRNARKQARGRGR